MIANREYTIDDYLAMARRHAKVILIPMALAPLLGWLVSYLFSPKYTSQSVVMVEGQKVPENMVQPVVSEDLQVRISTLKQQVTSQRQLQQMLERIGLARNTQAADEMVDTIRTNMNVTPVPDLYSSSPQAKKKPGQVAVPGFFVSYTGPNAREAQQICNELTSMMITENSNFVAAAAKGTTDVLDKGLEDAKHNLDDLDSKLAAFKKQYVGQLPGDEDNNFKILMGLNTQLEQNTSTLNRAQQDKTYTEALLAQQLAAWKSSQSSSNPQTLQKQLDDLQSQLLSLQARYTADHPDVIKAKADIAEVKKKLAEVNSAPEDASGTDNQKASATEPGEIRQLRLQIHQYQELIAASTRDQARLQKDINVYQNRVSLSPAVEEQYKQLARDYDNASKNYQDLLAKKSGADLTVKMTNQQQGERMYLADPASMPDSPSFPNRWIFAGGGLGGGLVLGLIVALWLEVRDNSIRTEADAEAALELPLLVAIPWVAEPASMNGNGNGNGNGRFWKWGKKAAQHPQSIGA